MTKDTTCQPSSGKTYVTIGQDFFSIQEYLLSQYNTSLHLGSIDPPPVPAATMFYADIQTLRGLDTPVDYGSGIEYADGLAQAFPDSGIQIGLWLNGTAGCHDVVRGQLDSQIRRLFAFLKAVDVPKVFLRVGYEFDNPSFGYSDPLAYKQAFRKMVNSCEQMLGNDVCHDKIAFCWHSWAAKKQLPLHYYYPGDDVVDWIGLSLFQQLYPWAAADNNFAGGTKAQVLEVLDYAKLHDKPIMIAESTPFGGMYLEDNPNIASLGSGDEAENIWDLWFQPVLDLIDEYDIGMWSYINCDWNSQPMWKGIGFGDTRLSISQTVMTRWRTHVLSEQSRFVNRLSCSSVPPSTATFRPSPLSWLGTMVEQHNPYTSSDDGMDMERLANIGALLPLALAAIGLLALLKKLHHRHTQPRHNDTATTYMLERQTLQGQEGDETGKYGSITC